MPPDQNPYGAPTSTPPTPAERQDQRTRTFRLVMIIAMVTAFILSAVVIALIVYLRMKPGPHA